MLGKALGHPECEANPPRHAGCIDLDDIVALERVFQGRLADLRIDGAKKKWPPEHRAADALHLHRGKEDIGRGKIEVEFDRGHGQPQPLAPAALASASCWLQELAPAGA